MSPERKSCYQRYNHLYKWFHVPGAEPFTCFYCGQHSNTVDHIPPITRVSDYRAFSLEHEFYLKVHCCRECNSILGDSLQESVIEREMQLKNRLEAKYNKDLSMPTWDKKSIRGLGRNLRRKIDGYNARKKIATERLEYSKGINAFIDHLESVCPEALQEEAA